MSSDDSRMRGLLIDGQMDTWHNMSLLSGAITDYLEETGLFVFDHVSTPPRGEDMAGFSPDFEPYDLVVVNYDGDEWPDAARAGLEQFVSQGGGLVAVHMAINAFPEWPAWNEMMGIGGWNGRDEKSGPIVYWADGEVQYDHGPGEAFHPPKHDFPVTIRNGAHPVTTGLPGTWLHAHDELYSCMRGPARNMQLLATGYADQSMKDASDRHEPVMTALSYGKGRVFHTTLGHVGKEETELPLSVRCAGFITVLQRGAEWAAIGEVTQTVPEGLPGPDSTSVRPR